MSIFSKADRLPTEKVDAIMVLSYCVAESDQSRLTIMGEKCMREAARLFKTGIARHLIITAAQETAAFERDIKLNLASAMGISTNRIIVIMPIMDTYDEARQARVICEKHNFSSLLLIAESRHMPRAFRLFRRVLHRVELYNHSVYSPYEAELYTEADGVIKEFKRLRSRFLVMRLFVEWGLNIALPFFVKKRRY